ncbi:MAG TPA: hypothetical protein VI299_08220, partial [Polyangiales bacterium]
MRTYAIASFLVLASSACAKPAAPPRTAVTPDAPESRAPADESLGVSGLLGTLSQREIQGALEPKLPKFLRCATQRLGELDVLAGALTMRFNVAVDGSVAAVQPVESTLGDR